MHPYDRTQQTVNYLTSETDLPSDGQVTLKHPLSSTAYIRFENNEETSDASQIKHHDNYSDQDNVLLGATVRNCLELSSLDDNRIDGDSEGDLILLNGDTLLRRGIHQIEVGYIGDSGGLRHYGYCAGGTAGSPASLVDSAPIKQENLYRYGIGAWQLRFTNYYYANGNLSLRSSDNYQPIYEYFAKKGTQLTWSQNNSISLDLVDGIVTMPRQSTIYGYLSANQTVNHGVTTAWVAIEFNTFTRDTQSEMTSYTFTATADGVYSVTLTVSAGYTGSIAYQQIGFNLNGTMSKRIPMYRIAGTAYAHLSDNISLSAGDSLYFALQYSATAVDTFDINSGPNSSFCSIVKLM